MPFSAAIRATEPKKMIFARVIRMGKNSGDVITGIQQRLNTCTTHIVISEDYGFHERSSS